MARGRSVQEQFQGPKQGENSNRSHWDFRFQVQFRFEQAGRRTVEELRYSGRAVAAPAGSKLVEKSSNHASAERLASRFLGARKRAEENWTTAAGRESPEQ